MLGGKSVIFANELTKGESYLAHLQIDALGSAGYEAGQVRATWRPKMRLRSPGQRCYYDAIVSTPWLKIGTPTPGLRNLSTGRHVSQKSVR